jgi:hypothetical protein
MAGSDSPPPPTPEEIADLKRLAKGIMRAQGNRFVKELLRKKKAELPDRGIRIGATKDAFEHNVLQAIEDGDLRLGDFDDWAEEVEGWGNQHVYVYAIPDEVRAQLTPQAVRQKVTEAGLDDVWNGSTLLEFPEEPQLTSISFDDDVLRLVWQESSPGWTPVPERNIPPLAAPGSSGQAATGSAPDAGAWVTDSLRRRIAKAAKEGIDTWEYRAYRLLERRAFTRFEARLEEGLAALFIAYPIQGDEHENAKEEARKVIGQLLDLEALEEKQFDISDVSRNIDQANVPTQDAPPPKLKSQKSRLGAGDSYVEFAARSRKKAYWEEPAVLGVRASVKKEQAAQFEGTEGIFLFPRSDQLSQDFRVQLYGNSDRIRLWAQMKVGEVWSILRTISSYR